MRRRQCNHLVLPLFIAHQALTDLEFPQGLVEVLVKDKSRLCGVVAVAIDHHLPFKQANTQAMLLTAPKCRLNHDSVPVNKASDAMRFSSLLVSHAEKSAIFDIPLVVDGLLIEQMFGWLDTAVILQQVSQVFFMCQLPGLLRFLELGLTILPHNFAARHAL